MLKKPVWRMAEDDDNEGGAGDDGADEEEFETDDESGDDSGDDDSDDDGNLDPAAKKALAKIRADLKETRRQLREERNKAKKEEDEDERVRAVEAKWKPRVVNSAARAALLEAGGNKPDRLLKLLDHDELDVRENGTVDGLDEEVDRLRDEYPELFSSRRRGTRVETGDRSGGDRKKQLSATERQARQMTGGR